MCEQSANSQGAMVEICSSVWEVGWQSNHASLRNEAESDGGTGNDLLVGYTGVARTFKTGESRSLASTPRLEAFKAALSSQVHALYPNYTASEMRVYLNLGSPGRHSVYSRALASSPEYCEHRNPLGGWCGFADDHPNPEIALTCSQGFSMLHERLRSSFGRIAILGGRRSSHESATTRASRSDFIANRRSPEPCNQATSAAALTATSRATVYHGMLAK
ncbi:hypothetical protein NUW54_g13269 [Trametes sanguinea]|uniref:Uncharacterized protein n=1 Tax=Trametes sanguinea TaxID=158606 RepID=A0ACC1MNK5_9APHY|nr:hypothetical protein NUW54_g13269 [Trametes sanguinea]